ncbi:MAG: TolB family protein [Candidatus Promineifilaceae bacterium]
MTTPYGRIAYINTQGQLCTCDADGGNKHELTRPDRAYQFPAWSPDGKHIAAVGSDKRGTGVYCFEDDPKGQQWQLYRSWMGSRKSPFYLYWSPDSKTVSFIANHRRHGIGFFLVKAEANAKAELIAHGQPFFWQWRSDSAEILIHSGINTSKHFKYIKPFKSDLVTRNHAHPGNFQSPGISHDGRYLAFSTTSKANVATIVLEEIETGEKTCIDHKSSTVFSWSPTRNELAFMAPQQEARHHFGPLMLAQLSGKTKQLTPYPVLAFFWSPNGRKLAYFTPTQNDQAFQLSGGNKITYLNGHSPPRMLRGTEHRQPAPLDLNLWIVDMDQRTRRKLFEFRPTQLFLNQFLSFFDQYAHSHRVWSPDSQAIILPVAQGVSQREITVIPISGAKPTVVGKGVVGFWQQQGKGGDST